MKKSALILAAALLVAGFSSCSKSAEKTDAETTETAAQNEEDIVDGANPQVEAEAKTAPENLIELKGDDLTQLTAAEGQVLAIDFGATWCGPCQKFHPTFDEAAAKYPAAKFVYVDVDENEAAAEKYNVEAVPTIIVIDNKGKETRYTGIDELLPSEKFFSIIENASK
ncbi:MAG: thioredoxin family protein [Muribaculaceae bacterium]|nr:thioredoxin family protein [Muribaculaceae bacterium]MDE5929106.1 thioredoxin family protein [Muribaculaceae bacterium]MDE6131088.1 thioredoxin family protein [Muribaculaceae bacterium]